MRMLMSETPKEGDDGGDHEGGENLVGDDDLVVAMEAEDDEIDLEELDDNERAEFNVSLDCLMYIIFIKKIFFFFY